MLAGHGLKTHDLPSWRRAPIGGLGSLQLVLQRNGDDTTRLPTAHTCFNVLLIPDYATLERLRDRLLLAIENTRGFGLQ